MKYKYFVSYAYQKGFGNLEYLTNRRLNSISSIQELSRRIEKDNYLKEKEVVVLYFISLKKEKT